MNRPVYMDYAAATPLDPRVVKVMVDCLTLEGSFANPSSKDHVFGWEAAEVVENARKRGFNGKVIILSGYTDFKYLLVTSTLLW